MKWIKDIAVPEIISLNEVLSLVNQLVQLRVLPEVDRRAYLLGLDSRSLSTRVRPCHNVLFYEHTIDKCTC